MDALRYVVQDKYGYLNKKTRIVVDTYKELLNKGIPQEFAKEIYHFRQQQKINRFQQERDLVRQESGRTGYC